MFQQPCPAASNSIFCLLGYSRGNLKNFSDLYLFISVCYNMNSVHATQPRPAKGFASGLRQSVRRFASHAFRNTAKTGMKKARIDMPRAGRENKDRDTPPPYYDFAASGICGQPLSLPITNRHVPLASSTQSLPMALSSRTVGVSHLSASEFRI